jgi:thioredoxin reductase
VPASNSGSSGQVVVAGAGYAGLHVALRLTAKLRDHPKMELTLVDRHDYHQVITELPRVAGGTRAAGAVRIPLQDTLAKQVRFAQTEINGFDLAGRRLLTGAGPIGWRRLVLALGSRPNDFAIPGLADRTLSLYSASDAEQVWAAVNKALAAAAAATDPERQRRLATVVVGGGGATGVELAGELAEILPEVASRHGLAPARPAVQLVEAGPTILAGSSPQLIDKATKILSDLGVQVRTNAAIAAATEEGFQLTDGQLAGHPARGSDQGHRQARQGRPGQDRRCPVGEEGAEAVPARHPRRAPAHGQEEDRRRGEPGWQVPAALLRPAPVSRGHRPGLQAAPAGRARLAGHEADPGPAPGLPPARGPDPRPHLAVLARAPAHPRRGDHLRVDLGADPHRGRPAARRHVHRPVRHLPPGHRADQAPA